MVGRIPVVFYRTSAGVEPVRAWLRALSSEDKKEIGLDLARLQFRWPVGMPFARSLGDGLWEVRSSLSSNRTARVLFCFHEGTIVVLHAFIKKTQKTPQDDIAVAIKRMRDLDL